MGPGTILNIRDYELQVVVVEISLADTANPQTPHKFPPVLRQVAQGWGKSQYRRVEYICWIPTPPSNGPFNVGSENAFPMRWD